VAGAAGTQDLPQCYKAFASSQQRYYANSTGRHTYGSLKNGPLHDIRDAYNVRATLDEGVPVVGKLRISVFKKKSKCKDLKHCEAVARILSSICSISDSKLQHSSLHDLNVSLKLHRAYC
jgi:hypothetical protein